MPDASDESRAARPPDLSIVLPVYNEAENVVGVIESLAAHVRAPKEVLVVYDFDEDTTLPVARRLQPTHPDLRLVRNRVGRGVLAAMRAGIATATAPYVLITMADGSDEYERVDEMLALARRGAAIVAGSRYMRGGRQIGGPRLKGLMSRLGGLSLYAVRAVPIHDPTSNFKLYSRAFLESVTIESRAGFELALELTVKATATRRSVTEVPTTWRDRTAGTSRFRLRSWLPHYLRWYVYALRARAARVFGLR